MASKAAPILNPTNGHYYEAIAVSGGITWPNAKTAAESLTFLGSAGYLATITSQQENDFIVANFPQAAAPPSTHGYWIGGFQPPGSSEPAGGWQWVTGESFIFTNWNTGEPNDGGGEDAIHFFGVGTSGKWNDATGTAWSFPGYVVEFDGPFEVEAPLDIKPQSCPNPLNTNSKGVVPVAIVGTASFDVTQVDVSTVQLEGVFPLSSAFEDTATPFSPFTGKADCDLDCTTAGPDGIQDLVLHFDTQTLVTALGTVSDGDCLVLELTGNLLDGTPIGGEDVVLILKKK